MMHNALNKNDPRLTNTNPSRSTLQNMNDLAVTMKDQFVIKSDEDITEEQIREEASKIKYKSDRINKYPSIGDQLDALYHAGVFPTDMAAKIKKVKDDNPKS